MTDPAAERLRSAAERCRKGIHDVLASEDFPIIVPQIIVDARIPSGMTFCPLQR